MQHDETDLK